MENVGVTVILINELQDVLTFKISETGISYLADNVVYLRYLERMAGSNSELVRGIATRRLGDPADIANGVRFFAAEASAWVTGQTIAIDGGSALL